MKCSICTIQIIKVFIIFKLSFSKCENETISTSEVDESKSPGNISFYAGNQVIQSVGLPVNRTIPQAENDLELTTAIIPNVSRHEPPITKQNETSNLGITEPVPVTADVIKSESKSSEVMTIPHLIHRITNNNKSDDNEKLSNKNRTNTGQFLDGSATSTHKDLKDGSPIISSNSDPTTETTPLVSGNGNPVEMSSVSFPSSKTLTEGANPIPAAVSEIIVNPAEAHYVPDQTKGDSANVSIPTTSTTPIPMPAEANSALTVQNDYSERNKNKSHAEIPMNGRPPPTRTPLISENRSYFETNASTVVLANNSTAVHTNHVQNSITDFIQLSTPLNSVQPPSTTPTPVNVLNEANNNQTWISNKSSVPPPTEELVVHSTTSAPARKIQANLEDKPTVSQSQNDSSISSPPGMNRGQTTSPTTSTAPDVTRISNNPKDPSKFPNHDHNELPTPIVPSDLNNNTVTNNNANSVHQFFLDLRMHTVLCLLSVILILLAVSLVFSFVLALGLLLRCCGIGVVKLFRKTGKCIKKRRGSSSHNANQDSGSLFPRNGITLTPYVPTSNEMY